MSNAKKITAITLITLLVSVALLGSGWITQTVSAIDMDDAISLEAAPHFRDLTYTVGTPSYSTGFDGMGDWKVSVGNPKLAIDQSNLVVTAPSASPVRMTLTAADETGINQTERSTVQIKVTPSNVTAQYTNVTLAANSAASDHITVSFHGSLVTLAYTNGETTTSSTLYSPAEKDVSYVISFELAESGATVYLYDSSSNLLANKLLDVADVHAGTIYAIHAGCSGLASGVVKVDYAFVTTTTTDRAWSEIEMSSMSAPETKEPTVVKVDPTKLQMIRSDDSITSSAYGMNELLATEDDEVANFIGTMGSTAEPSQRFGGQFVAVGWDDFRGSVEDQLKAQIAKGIGVLDADEIYLVDYYIDYLQLKTSMDQTIVTNELSEYRAAMTAAFANMGINLTETDAAVVSNIYTSTPMVSYGSNTMAILPAGANVYGLDWMDAVASLNPLTCAANYLMMNADEQAEYKAKVSSTLGLNGVNIDWPSSITDIIGIPDAEDAKDLVNDLTGTANETLTNMAQWTLQAIREGTASVFEFCNMTYLNLYSMYSGEVERWNAVLNTTMEQFGTMAKESLATLTGFFDSTVNEISTQYEETTDKLTNLNQEYMNWSNAMMVNTNAMFSQLLYDLSEQSAETQRYFMDQVTKGNEAVCNISDGISLSAQQTNAIFAELLSDGKAASGEGLSFGAFLGDASTTVTIILVVAVTLVAVVVIIYLMSGKKKSGRQRR